MQSPSVIHTQVTETRVAKLQPSVRDVFVRDTSLRGFGLRISPGNVKSFIIEATVKGRFIRKVIGRHPFVTVAEARKTALEALAAVRYGIPQPVESNAPEAILSLSKLASDFLSARAQNLRPSTIKDYRIVLEGPYFEDWKSHPVRSITRRAILDRYPVLVKKHGKGMANKAMRVLSATLNYGRAVYPDLEDWANPIAVLSETRSRIPLQPRTGHIPPDQLGKWLAALDTFKSRTTVIPDGSRRENLWLLLNLILMTGLRSNEARTLRWQDVDLEKGVLIVRKEIAKNHREARLPLNRWLIEQLKNMKKTTGMIFAANREDGYIGNLRRPLDELHRLSGLRITVHDLRRSYATYLDLLGVPFGAIKQLLNHVSGSDITARYIQRYSIEKLREYSEHVAELVNSRRR